MGRRTAPRRWLVSAIGFIALATAMQLVPYGREHHNPAIVLEPAWDSPQTRALARRACFDCHSNETNWRAYARLAPASWLIQRDVVKGREDLNFSEWQRPQKEAREAADVIREGDMPPLSYRLLHRDARLTASERDLLARGLSRTVGGTEPRVGAARDGAIP
jgi:hypothetical protein